MTRSSRSMRHARRAAFVARRAAFVSVGILIAQAIVAMDMDLTETFKMFDKDGDGTVDIKEAKQARP